MRQTLEDYCREVEEKAEQFAQAEAQRERAEHLQAFNFGRLAQRVENSRSGLWLRMGWLVAGVALGAVLGSVFPNYLYPALAHKLFTQASLLVRELGKMGLFSLWKSPRVRV